MTTFSLTINAGGKSSRMGQDKAFVEVAGKPLIARILERTKDLGQSETLIISNHPEKFAEYGIKTVPDVLANTGSLGGIYSALHHSSSDYTLVIACDMPFISRDLLRYMLAFMNEGYEIIVPRVDNYPQGLHALYHHNCLPAIKKRLDTKQLKVIGFYDEMKLKFLDEANYQAYDPKGIALMNVNTPEELEQARQIEES